MKITGIEDIMRSPEIFLIFSPAGSESLSLKVEVRDCFYNMGSLHNIRNSNLFIFIFIFIFIFFPFSSFPSHIVAPCKDRCLISPWICLVCIFLENELMRGRDSKKWILCSKNYVDTDCFHDSIYNLRMCSIFVPIHWVFVAKYTTLVKFSECGGHFLGGSQWITFH